MTKLNIIKSKQILFKIIQVSILLLFSNFLLFIIESISRGGVSISFIYLRENFDTFFYNSLIALLTLSPFVFLKKRIFYIGLASISWILLAIGNNVLLTLRGTPLTGSDFGMIKNAIELIPKYFSTFSLILIAILIIALIVSLIFLYIKLSKSKINYYIALPLVACYVLMFPNITEYALDNNIVTKNFWDICEQYSTYGFPYSFLYSVFNSGINKPDGYSKDTILNIKDTVENLSLNNNNSKLTFNTLDSTLVNVTKNESNYDNNLIKPNIIIVQLESFMDPLWIKDVEFSEDPIPNFRYLSENYSSGLLNVPTIGGGTANTEFEVITGMSMDFFVAGEFPYNTLVSKKPVPSLAYYLQDLNYDSHALHNYDATYYTRYKVYENLGFHTFTSIENMDFYDLTPFQWPKDSVLIDQVKSALTSSDTPDLIFAISVQGHGGYADYYMDDLNIRSNSASSNYNINNIDYYVNQIHEMDIFIKDLISMVESIDEPSMIVFYGDHLPSLNLKADKLKSNSLTATPYVIWDNFNLPKEDKDLQSYEISSHILTKLNYPSTFLTNLFNSSLDEESKKEYLNFVEYDILYGNSYITESQEKLESRKDFRRGINYVVMDNIEFGANEIIIRGNNLNYYSQVYINDNHVKTTCIDKNTIIIDKTNLKVGDKIILKQISASRSIVLSNSNEIIVTSDMLKNN